MCEILIQVTCPHCEGTKVKKNGKKRNSTQNFYCHCCVKQFQLVYKNKGADPKNKRLVRSMTLNGSGIRDIQRVFRESYYLNYLFAAESRNALWNIDTFTNPFDVRLRLLRQNEELEKVVDVVETFNYLLGLVVETTYTLDGFRVVEGKTLDNERILIVWRNCNEKSAADLNRFFERMNFNVRDREFSKIYVNGEHTLTNSLDTNAPKVLQIEGVFHKRMFV